MKKKEEHPITKEKKHKARRRSIKEGIFSTANGSFGNRFISPLAIAINSSSSLVALYGSVSGLLGPLSQMFSSRLIERYSRKKVVLRGVLGESLLWLPFIAIALLFYYGIALQLLPLFLIGAFAIQLIFANMAGPAWFSWIGDIVDEEYRGRWFAKRNLILGFTSIIFAISASFFLDYFKKIELVMIGFVVLFTMAMISRLIAWHLFKRQYEPRLKLKKGYYFSFWDFILNSPKNNFGKFALFRATLAFATAVAGPLIAVYLLRTLEFSYVTYMVITLAGSVVSLFVLELWGKIADSYGNYRVIWISSFFIPTIPVLWILSPNPIYLVFVPSIIGSMAWAGFNLAAGNFVYDNVSQERRGLCVSYKNMLLGIGTFLGAGLGAILIKYIQTNVIAPIVIIFVISGVLRLLAVAIWLPRLKEVRKTKKFNGTRGLKDLIFKEVKPTVIEETHQLISIKKYLFDD